MNKTGVHYTPEYIADFVVEKVGKYLVTKEPTILEPCLGEGVFIKSLRANLGENVAPIIDAVEICKETCEISRKMFDSRLLKRITNIDFLRFNTKKKYDLIIGNPPYVNKKYMTNEQINACAHLAGLVSSRPSKNITLKNLWTAFIVKSCSMLSDNGIVAFVLPSDIAHVNHAKPIKDHLKKIFSRIELYELNDFVFDDAEQNAIIMIAVKRPGEAGLGVFHSNVYVKNSRVSERKIRLLNNLSPNKWTNYGLSRIEGDLLKRVNNELYQVKEFCNSYAGIVTAANDYFILNEEELDKHGLRKYAVPIIQKAAYVNGSVAFGKREWEVLRKSNSPCFLLDFSKGSNRSAKAKKYLSLGIENKVHDRYKCKAREEWCNVPNINTAEGFFFKRCHLYPKLIMNNADICVTDTAYSVYMNNGYNLRSLIYSFYNSFSLVYSEILGRKYAGGVLELTPSEFRNIPLPYVEINGSDFTEFKNKFSGKDNISKFISDNNKLILRDGLGLDSVDVRRIHGIYQKIISRRLNN